MSTIEEIFKKSLCLENELERKLYCIKENNFVFNQQFKNKCNFEFQILSKNTKGYHILLGGERYYIHQKSRIIDFIIDGESNKKFIYSSQYLKNIFDKCQIEYYSIKEENLDNSLDSQVSEEEIFNIFENQEIKTIYKIKSNCEKYLDIFKNRHSDKYQTISNLSLNAEFYYPNNYNDNINEDLYNICFDDMYKNLWTNANIIYLIGPKGVSKSIFLLYFLSFYNIENKPSLYINYQVMKNLGLKERKNIFKKEMVYLFFNDKKFKDFYDSKYHKIIKKESNFLKALKTFVTNLINIYANTFDEKITLIIDNFNENEKNICDELEELIKLVKENKNKIRLILSGHSKLLNNKLKLFIKNKGFDSKIDDEILKQLNLKLEGDNEIKSLPAFNYRKNINDSELENVLLREEIDYCKKFNIFGMYYSLINNGNHIILEKLINYFDILPIDYLNFKINEDNSITFNFHNKIYEKAVKKSIKVKIEETSLKEMLKEETKTQLIKGIYEEKLLTLLISYNNVNLNNIKTSENNLLEVKEIVNFKNNSLSKTNNKIDKGMPIIVTQELFKGAHYDLLVLISEKIEDKDYYTAYMVQIGTNKTKNQIDTIKEDFESNKQKYKSGIKGYIDNDIKLNDIQLVFIFDKDTQETLRIGKNKIEEIGSKYCISKKIKFYLFSLKDIYLYKTSDVKFFEKISIFGDFDASNKRGWDQYLYSEAKLNFYFLNETEIEFINKTKNIDIFKNINRINIAKDSDFPEKTDYEIIYILKNKNRSYYIVNNVVYYLDKENFQEFNIKNLDKKDKFMSYMLIEDKELKGSNMGKKLK